MTLNSDVEVKVPAGELIVTKTNTEGTMTYGSQSFFQLTGYKEAELLGQSHQILHHPDVPKAYYKLLLDFNANGREYFGVYKAKTKQGNYYWGFVHVTPNHNGKKQLLGYQSITRPAKPQAVDEFSEWYRQMRDIERNNKTSKSVDFIFDQIAKKGLNYSEFLFSCRA